MSYVERDTTYIRSPPPAPRPHAYVRPSERCGVAIGRKNYLFAGSDAGGRRAAVMYSLIESAKPNGINPQLYLAVVAPE